MPTIVNRPLLMLKVDLLGTEHLLPTPPALALTHLFQAKALEARLN